MVSQADHPYYASSVTLRGTSSLVGGSGGGSDSSHPRRTAPSGYGAASVVGRHAPSVSSSRTRRYNRSHVGGNTSASSSSFAPRNEFPVFVNTGDVEIIVRVRSGHENRYLLHRDTLARCSAFFEASTSKEWSRAQTIEGTGSGSSSTVGGQTRVASGGSLGAIASGGELARLGPDGDYGSSSLVGSLTGGEGKRRWRYELDLGQNENDKPILVQKEKDEMSSSTTTTTTATQSIFGGGGPTLGASLPYRERNSGRAAPTHGNSNFFRSVANLALSHSSTSRGHHDRSGSGSDSHRGYEYTGYRLSNPLYCPPPAHLALPTPDDIDLLRDYDNLFRIMYNYPPLLDGVSIADAYVQCKSLLAVADEYDALAIVGPRVDHHLLQFQSRLWRQIAKYPISYLRLGFMARSRVIFQEALVHVVGQWPAGERSLRAAMPDAVINLIEDKVDELAEAVSRIEAYLFRLHLTTRNGERVSPATAYLDWLAVSLFRQWIAENTTPAAGSGVDPKLLLADRRAAHLRGGAPRGVHSRSIGGRASSSSSSSDDSGRRRTETTLTLHARCLTIPSLIPPLATLGRTYRILGSVSSSAFLGHDECKRFLKMSPDLYSRDNLRRFEKRIEELKDMARELVRPLMGSTLELDVAGGGKAVATVGASSGPAEITYFTCTYVSDQDLPWDSVM